MNIKDPIVHVNAQIRKAEERLARIDAECAKLTQQSEAAHRRAAEMRAKAGEIAALVAVGDDDGGESDALALERQAEHEEFAAARCASTLTALNNFHASTEKALRGARAERKRLVMAAVDEHVNGVISEYVVRAQALRDVARRCLALERIRASLDDRRALLRLNDLELPAPANYTGPRAGAHNNLLYSATTDVLGNAENSPLALAIEAEFELLAKQGVEV
jgi:hypothetical protein